jgi:hypothetical protein
MDMVHAMTSQLNLLLSLLLCLEGTPPGHIL